MSRRAAGSLWRTHARPMMTTTLASVSAPIVLGPPSVDPASRKRGDHWTSDKPKGFQNPWPSFAMPSGLGFYWELFKFIRTLRGELANDPDFDNAAKLVPAVAHPDFGASIPDGWRKMKSTWMGHASFLVEMPAQSEKARGVTFLVDPAYSVRCSPFQSFGMKPRYTPPPATVEELPEIDVVVISHNHYDHCDLNTLKEIYTKHSARPPMLFVPLANAHTFKGIAPDECVVEMDWWDSREITVEGKGTAKIVCTPSQHTCARTPFDRDHALWSSWAMQHVEEDGSVGPSVWHGGDTGYCTVQHETHEIDPALAVCPAFKEIGERVGPFTLGLIPIGAYKPRRAMSLVHNAPIDAVRMFKDVQCKTAVGMHWGTWRMAMDRIAEPPELLVDARKAVGLTEEEFGVCALGETRAYSA